MRKWRIKEIGEAGIPQLREVLSRPLKSASILASPPSDSPAFSVTSELSHPITAGDQAQSDDDSNDKDNDF